MKDIITWCKVWLVAIFVFTPVAVLLGTPVTILIDGSVDRMELVISLLSSIITGVVLFVLTTLSISLKKMCDKIRSSKEDV